MRRKHFIAAQLWYAISQGAPVLINPYLNLYFTTLAFSPSQIGFLSALRPWVSAPAGSLVAGLADRWQAHRAVLLTTYLAVTAVQGSMALCSSFAAMLALTLAASCVYTPSSIIADASVMAASEQPGDFGKVRTWASLSWTAIAPLAGWVNSSYGMRVGIACYVVGSLLAVPAAAALPVHALRRGVAPLMARAASAAKAEAEAEQEAAAAAVRAPEEAQLRVPLLAEEAPPTPSRARMLSKALAIVRYIEAITELSIAPPTGASLYGYADLPTPYAARHLAPRPASELAEGEEAGEVAAAGPGSLALEDQRSPFRRGAPGALPDVEWGEQSDTVLPPVPPTAVPLSPTCHPPSLPRPISTGSLPRVASLAQGIPRIRTRLLATVPSADLAALPEPEPEPEPGSEAEGEGSTSRESTSLEASPAASEDEHPALFAADVEEEGGMAAPFQRKQERQGAGQPVPPALRPGGRLRPAVSATNLLAGLRSAGAPASAGARAGMVHDGSGELPLSYGAAAEAEAEAGVPAASDGAPAAGQQVLPGQEAGTGGEALASAPTTPLLRTAAVQRLAQIFAGGGGATAGGAGAEAAQEAGGGEGAAETPGSAGSRGSGTWEGLLSPVRRFVEHRKGKLEARRQLQRQELQGGGQEAAAAMPPLTPRSSGLAAALLFGSGAGVGALELPPSLAHMQQEVTPELMQEAVELEAGLTDVTGSMVVGMLGKKLERMAAESRRQERRRMRLQQQQQQQAVAPTTPRAEAEAAGTAGPQELPGTPPGTKLAQQRAAAAAAEAEEAAAGGVACLFSDPGTATFFVICTLLGFGHGVVGAFLFVFLSELGGTESLMGAVLVANALPELPAFYFFGSIMSALGMNTVLLTASACLGLRVAGFALLPRLGVRWVVALEALHAVTYACGWSACAISASKISPPGLESTTQAIFQGLWTGVGCGLGGLLGGLLYAGAGGQTLFLVCGGIILVGTAACAAVLTVLRRRAKRRLAASASFSSLPASASSHSLAAAGAA